MRSCGRSVRLILIAVAVLSGCQAPHFAGEHRTPATGPAPKIEPLDQVLAVGGAPEIQPEDPVALESRAAQLRARSAELSAQTTDDGERNRLIKAAEGAP